MPGWEIIVVILVVAVAAVWSGRSIWRSARAGKICSSCSESGSCPLAGNPEHLNEILNAQPGDHSSCSGGEPKENP